MFYHKPPTLLIILTIETIKHYFSNFYSIKYSNHFE